MIPPTDPQPEFEPPPERPALREPAPAPARGEEPRIVYRADPQIERARESERRERGGKTGADSGASNGASDSREGHAGAAEPAAGDSSCPEAESAEREWEYRKAAEAYRDCLFESGAERAGVDRQALYLRLIEAAGQALPAFEPGKKEKRQLEGLVENTREAKPEEETPKALRKLQQKLLFEAPWWAESHYAVGAWHESRRDAYELRIYYRAFLAAVAKDDARRKPVEAALKAAGKQAKSRGKP